MAEEISVTFRNSTSETVRCIYRRSTLSEDAPNEGELEAFMRHPACHELSSMSPGEDRHWPLGEGDEDYRCFFAAAFRDSDALALVGTVDACPEHQGRAYELEVSEQGGAHRLTVRITSPGEPDITQTILRAGIVEAPPSANAAADAEDGFDSLAYLARWEAPTEEESTAGIAALVEGAVGVQATEAAWETELTRLRERTRKEIERLAQLTEEQSVQAPASSEGGEQHALYQLQLAGGRNLVLAPRTSDDEDVRAVWPGPAREGEKHGKEERSVIEVVETKKVWGSGGAEVWLRYRPLAGDTKQCWVRQECANGAWQQAPRDDPADLQ